MSENYLRVIPTDPVWVPDEGGAAAALQVLKDLCPRAQDVVAERHDEIRFIDQGGNFVAVRCPRCRAELSLDWWHERMNAGFEGGFAELSVVTPCCSRASTLNDLDYDWPAGFARFVLSAASPGRTELVSDEIASLAEALRHPVREIWARY